LLPPPIPRTTVPTIALGAVFFLSPSLVVFIPHTSACYGHTLPRRRTRRTLTAPIQITGPQHLLALPVSLSSNDLRTTMGISLPHFQPLLAIMNTGPPKINLQRQAPTRRGMQRHPD